MTIEEKAFEFNKQQFLRGFTEELKAKTIVKRFYTTDGQNSCALIEIDGKEFEVKYWNTYAYCIDKRPKDYIYSCDIEQLHTKLLDTDLTPILSFSAHTYKLLDSKDIDNLIQEVLKAEEFANAEK